MKRFLLLVLATQVGTGCMSSSVAVNLRDTAEITVHNLLDRPHEFDGKRVRVTGWVTLEPENYNLWDSKSAMEDFDTHRCVSLQSYQAYVRGDSRLGRKLVVATGVFNSDVTRNQPIVRLNACNSAALDLDASSELRAAE